MRSDSVEKEIFLLGMMHLGQPEYYADARRILDSLRNEGYVVFFEGVGKWPPDMDSISRDTIQRKFRKVARAHITHYQDGDNQSMTQYRNKKYVPQTLGILGLYRDSAWCVHADLNYPEMIARYEEDRGEIPLNSYDWNTPLLEKYKWRKGWGEENYSRYYLLRNVRDEFIVDSMMRSAYPKIVGVYGFGHLDGMEQRLAEKYGLTPVEK